MPKPNPALLPRPALFDVTIADSPIDRRIDRIPLEEIELAANARRDISQEGIERLAAMLCRTGQLIPCIGHRPSTDGPVLIYDGQRRYLAANASHELAGSEGYEGLQPIRSLIVLLLDHEPSADEIRRIQAQANQREQLSLVDQQEQFRDCWAARAGLREDDRIAAVCADLGISAKRAHNLRRQLDAPRRDPHTRRRAARRRGAVGHDGQPPRRHARDRTPAHRGRREADHDRRSARQGAQGHGRLRATAPSSRTSTPTPSGSTTALCSTPPNRSTTRESTWPPMGSGRSRGYSAASRTSSTASSTPSPHGPGRERSRSASPARSATAPATADTRSSTTAARTSPPAIWVVDPAFMIDLVHQELKDDTSAPAREEAYFAGARLDDDELRDAAAEDEQRRAQARARHAEATRSNLGLGHDIRAGLLQPTDAQLQALRRDRLPAARPPLRRADRLRRRLDRPRAPTARRRHRPPRARTRSTRSSTPSSSERSGTPTRSAASRSSPPAGRRVRAGPRRGHPHQGARNRADGAQAPRRAARRRRRAPRRRVGVHAADALAGARRRSTATRSSSRTRSRRPSTSPAATPSRASTTWTWTRPKPIPRLRRPDQS